MARCISQSTGSNRCSDIIYKIGFTLTTVWVDAHVVKDAN